MIPKIFFFCVISILSGCSFVTQDTGAIGKQEIQKESIFEVVVLPHHNLTGKKIDDFYTDLKEKYQSFDRIIIVSPDHFGLTHSPIESVPEGLRKVCFEEKCVQATPLNPYGSGVSFTNDYNEHGVTREHGIGEHIKRISRFFPESIVSPVIIRRKLDTREDEKRLADTIAEIRDKRVLLIVSVDFSHHVREELAKLHDTKSIDTLNLGHASDFKNLEVDCQNCLAVGKIVAEKIGKNFFHFTDRTSVDILSQSGSELENTSHIFGAFSSTGMSDSTGVFLFVGDTHWARGFPYYEKKSENYREKVTSLLYQKYDPTNDPLTKYHRIFSGFDEVVVNWESGIADTGKCPKSGKTTQMSTDPAVFPYFHSLGITLANIANNHSHDCGKKLFDESFDRFLSGGITPFGYDTIAFREIRGNQYAFVGIDQIESHPDMEKIKKSIQSLTSSGYLVIVNIHWGIEYKTEHSKKQEQLAHDMIDAGARLIIGHHPHVVEDKEIYKGIPIYYSLGNFLFDQPFPETLRGLLVGCEVSKTGTTCTDVSVYRDPKDYSLHF